MQLEDFFGDPQINRLRKDLDRLRKNVATPNPFAPKAADIEALQAEVGELRLQVAVLFRILLSRGMANQAEVQELLQAFDAADGEADGTFQGDPVSGEPRAPLPESKDSANPFPKIRL